MNIFESYYNVKKVLQYYAVSVHKEYRGANLPLGMDGAAEMNAEILGYPLKFAMVTRYYTLQICHRLVLDCVQRLKYTDYKDSKTGQPIFNLPPPHWIRNVCKTNELKNRSKLDIQLDYYENVSKEVYSH